MIGLRLAGAVRAAALELFPSWERLRLLMLALVAALAFAGSAAKADPTFPPLTGRVVDDAHILPAQTQAELTQKLATLEQANGDQLVVVTLSSLQDYDIADYGYRLGRAWGIGQKGQNNGALLIIAPNEKKVRIEAGYGLEPVLTDAVSSLIIQREILPRFREGDYAGGTTAGVDALIRVLAEPRQLEEAQAREAAQEVQRPHRRADPGAVIVIIIIAVFVLSGLFRRGRGGGGGALWPLLLLSSFGGRGRDDDDWGGGGGGGGFGGGGGSFGGGGASGGW
jgi:uncharacterized protein